jgi:hypothetical protein
MIPKRIWFLWLQGIEKAPALVRTCLESWRYWNPEWRIEVLDWTCLETFLPSAAQLGKRWPGMHAAALSDLIRVNLLDRHGGVWTDATCLCRKPLDVWLPYLAQTGFFAFANPAEDRLVATWFLAAEPETRLIKCWRDEANRYWDNGHQRELIDIPELLGSPTYAPERANRMLWFDEAQSYFGTHYPYFWFHYLFERLMQKPACASQWHAVPKISAHIPHRLQHIGLDRPMSDEYVREFQRGIAPLYKLTHKRGMDHTDQGTLIGYCLDPANW